jgi:hypothetical protein
VKSTASTPKLVENPKHVGRNKKASKQGTRKSFLLVEASDAMETRREPGKFLQRSPPAT